MKDKFVPYEIAKRLKELGFKEPCITYWYTTKENRTPEIMFRDADIKNGWINGERSNTTAPLWQDVIDWLREEKKILVDPYGISTVQYGWVLKRVSDGHVIGRNEKTGTYKETLKNAIEKALTFVTPL